jgi:photosystem II stability/assembly factor-like uncharacterized protein
MRHLLSALALAAIVPVTAHAQALRADSAFLSQLRWRSVGPANMSGRVSDVEANHLNPKVIYAAFATGGVWKSVNAGTTWIPVFDATGAHAVSELAIAPSDTSVIWAGTGEEDSRNSISPGNGVYRSTDAGRTWQHMGLRESQHIGRIVIHPTQPNTVWVAALGAAWGRNPQRGVYKTTDGGQTWRLVKFVSDRAGAVDIAINPSNPNHLLAAFWERQRTPYSLHSGGPGSGLWESSDGGESWRLVTGNGLPTTTWGRAGIAFAPSNGNVVYIKLEADSAPNPASLRRGFVPDTTRRARLESGLFRSTDAGRTWERMNRENNRPFYYSLVKVDPQNPDRVYWLATQIRYSNDGGRTYRQVGQGIHVDYHGIWINPSDPEHYIVGQDGGLAQTFDRGRTYDAILQFPAGQFYAIGVDMQRPYYVCGGLQDNGTWCGPSATNRNRIMNQDWVNVNGGDGFYAAIDPTNPDLIYAESQGGAVSRLDLNTWQRRGIRPGMAPAGNMTIARMLEDSLLIARGDTTRPMTPEQRRIHDAYAARIAQDTGLYTRNRWNWSSPFFISPHNPATLYMGGHRVWKTVNRGDSWQAISGDLSTADTMRIRISLTQTGGITSDVTTAETHGTVTSVAESPLRAGLLFAGTDDGNVWLTRNDGATWENLTGRFPGLPPRTWVTRVAPSPHDSMTVYVTFDGHRTNDFRPYAYVSNDMGRTFRGITSGIPAGEYVHAITESPRRRGLLFLGTELTAYVSTDGGASWIPFNSGLPPVPVHDLVVHPRDRDLVAGTHGRSIWIVDIGPLEQANNEILAAAVHLFEPEPALTYNPRISGGGVGAVGSKLFQVPTPGPGARIPIRITQGVQPRQIARGPDAAADPGEGGEAPAAFGGGGGGGGGGGFGGFGGGQGQQRPPGDTVMIVITDVRGDTLRTLYTNANNTPLRYVTWDLRRTRTEPLGPAGVRDSIRAAQRQQFLRDSIRAAQGDTAQARRGPGGPGGPGAGGGFPGAQQRDPTPGEPGTPVNMAGENWGIRPGQRGGGGFGGLGGLGPVVEPGTYLVTVRFNGRDYRQTVTVVRPQQTSTLAGGWQ